MPRAATQADFFEHLTSQCVPGVEDPVERIRVYLSGAKEDLDSAAADLVAYRSRAATSDIGDAAMLLGEAIAFACRFRVLPGEGHRWNAIRVLRLYVQSHVPALSRQAAQLDLLRTYRHRVKYDGAEAPLAQTKLYYDVVSGIYQAIKDLPLEILGARRAGEPGNPDGT